jgi:hypothetical protein
MLERRPFDWNRDDEYTNDFVNISSEIDKKKLLVIGCLPNKMFVYDEAVG